MLVALGGIWLAWAVYVKRLVDYEQLYQRFKPLHTLFKEQFFTEKLYHKVLARGYLELSRLLYRAVDREVIDGFINFLYEKFFVFVKALWKSLDIKVIDILIHEVVITAVRVGRSARQLQTGLLNHYVLFMVLGTVLVLGVMLFVLDRM
ncbi:MAG: hypothetical protein GXO03_00300 [Aquificae bacterium]|nr:hypothetical protein [Aquificota bacterium]